MRAPAHSIHASSTASAPPVVAPTRLQVAAPPPAGSTMPSLVERVRLGLMVGVMVCLAFIAYDLIAATPGRGALQAARLVVIATATIGFVALRWRPDERIAAAVLIAMVTIGMAAATISGILEKESVTGPAVCGAIALAAAALLPWGVGPQLALVGLATAAVALHAAWGGLSLPGAATAFGALALSIYLTRVLARARQRAASVEAALRVYIAERTRAEEALRESEEMLRSVLESAHDFIMKVGLDGRIEFLNRVYPPVRLSDVVGRSIFDFTPVESRPTVRALLDRVVASGRGEGYDQTAIIFDRLVCFRTKVAPIRREGRVVGFTFVSADVTEQQRIETAQREEAAMTAALARVGRELIASLDTPVLLQRLCELTTEVFGCEASHTFLPTADGFAVVAGTGDTPEQYEAQRALRLPTALIAPIVERLERDGVLQVVIDEAADLPTAALSRKYGVTLAIYFPFRKGGEIVGVQSAAFRGRRAPLGEAQLRLAAGIGHLASLALETARLVEALNAADRFKTDFLANMSHELRTPLNVIIGYNEMLLDAAYGELGAEQRATLERVQRNARELLHLVTTALEISRYEAHGIPLEREWVMVPALLDDLARETGALPEKPGLAIAWEVGADLPPLHTDLLKLKMVLKNLLDNGIKFTPQGRVTFAALARDGGVEFRIADTGVGIPREAIALLFEPFQQGAHTKGNQAGGVGLGLYIVRRLVEALGGSIRVESEVGVGSLFAVWIPRATGPDAAAAAH
ncbi:MAG: PAS domain-containing sensor histidine kinase [Deltaproteobacteria bacterium]|nr:PAS domain-containing sensor histidine kinase [Deltaproteobacteria bacterium]